ncbi:MAG: single-stranded-DNA-specific exonuclease RecJ [Candidatus Gracilibacteria bacterium]|jgi:single-stranded-DNA-specific exonuclease
MSLFGKKWTILYERKPNENLFAALSFARNIEDPGTFFADTEMSDLSDPFLFKNMQKAVERIFTAIKNGERIAIYGDYDVDGISGTAILVHTLNFLGAKVTYRIPSRLDEGYGLHTKYVEELAKQNVKLLITVDTGIACANEIALARERGMDTIVTDHHAIPKNFTVDFPAFAILHPLEDNDYPHKNLSGSAVAFKLAAALLYASENQDQNSDFTKALTDLAALGIVADCVPLTGENRKIVKIGLKQMSTTKWDGLKEILKLAGVWDKQDFSAFTIGFQVSPRLNASGRMDSPYWALQTLLASGEEAAKKGEKLEGFNRLRRSTTEKACVEAQQMVNQDDLIILAGSPDWSSGILGLVAGKILESSGRPAFIMEDKGGELVGSVRSLSGFNAVEALNAASEHLTHFGGHELAAGFRLKKESLEAFKEALLKHAKMVHQESPFIPTLKIDTTLHAEDLTLENIEKLNTFAPFGQGNPHPVLLIKDAKIIDTRKLGKDGTHLRCIIKIGPQTHECMAFGLSHLEPQIRSAKHLVVTLDKGSWQGEERIEMKLIDAE